MALVVAAAAAASAGSSLLPCNIERRANLSRQELVSKYQGTLPVILTGGRGLESSGLAGFLS